MNRSTKPGPYNRPSLVKNGPTTHTINPLPPPPTGASASQSTITVSQENQNQLMMPEKHTPSAFEAKNKHLSTTNVIQSSVAKVPIAITANTAKSSHTQTNTADQEKYNQATNNLNQSGSSSMTTDLPAVSTNNNTTNVPIDSLQPISLIVNTDTTSNWSHTINKRSNTDQTRANSSQDRPLHILGKDEIDDINDNITVSNNIKSNYSSPIPITPALFGRLDNLDGMGLFEVWRKFMIVVAYDFKTYSGSFILPFREDGNDKGFGVCQVFGRIEPQLSSKYGLGRIRQHANRSDVNSNVQIADNIYLSIPPGTVYGNLKYSSSDLNTWQSVKNTFRYLPNMKPNIVQADKLESTDNMLRLRITKKSSKADRPHITEEWTVLRIGIADLVNFGYRTNTVVTNASPSTDNQSSASSSGDEW